VQHEHDTVANMVRRMAQEAASMIYDDTWAYLNWTDYDEIEDAEIIEDNDSRV
jgi:predicted nucleotide-binding protein (sugar kinase/HSP70/actin superfamily)